MLLISLGPALDIALANLIIAGGAAAQAAIGMGLNLFAVLPGPLPPAEAFEELLASARNLNDRLRGTVQDERGEVLSAARIAAIREELAPGAPSAVQTPP